MNFDAFISYAKEDKAAADAACAKLEADGIRCWIAPRDVPPGAQWAGAIVDAIDHCRAMVLIFSSNANGSKQIHREVQRAFEREVPVVPFRIENVVPEQSLAYYMGPVHWLDALTPPLEQHLQKLVGSLKPFAHSKTFGERESEAQGPQAAEADKSATLIGPGGPEPRKPSRPSRWTVLIACVVGAVLVGSVGVWRGVPYLWSVTPEGTPAPPSAASVLAPANPVQSVSSTMEPSVNRYALDYRGFDLQASNPQLCQQACLADSACAAWTYVREGVQGRSPRCWLKNRVPDPTPDPCCTSGVVQYTYRAPVPPARTPMQPSPAAVQAPGNPIQGESSTIEPNVNRFGLDYRGFDLKASNPQLCQQACLADRACAAWTYVREGVQGRSPRCWLKNQVPDPTPDPCCTSGVFQYTYRAPQ